MSGPGSRCSRSPACARRSMPGFGPGAHCGWSWGLCGWRLWRRDSLPTRFPVPVTTTSPAFCSSSGGSVRVRRRSRSAPPTSAKWAPISTTRRRQPRQRLADRRRALELAARDPSLAQEIGIGRPDRRGAAHGGLVDVNNASARALQRLPGVDGHLAARIVATRGELGGFSSLEDLGETLDIDGGTVERIRGRAVFLPRP